MKASPPKYYKTSEMKFYLAILVLYCVSSVFCDEGKKEALLDEKAKKVAEKDDDDAIDHKAFLQIDDSADLQIQNSRPSRLKMRKLIKEIDNDKDGKISKDELADWIKQVTNKLVMEEGEKQMPKIDKDGDNHATWEEYKKAAGYSEGDKVEPKSSSETSKQHDKAKFELADVDGDGKLSYYELGIMIHPNEDKRTSSVIVNEFLLNIDKDKDGKLSIKEFSGETVPEEMNESFSKFDTNKDGFLDSKELRDWLAPENKDIFELEIDDLIINLDDNKDGFLTEKEIFKHYAHFATSRATKYGRLLIPDDKKQDRKRANKTKNEKIEL